MSNELDNQKKTDLISKKINLHLQSLANGEGSFDEVNLIINALKEEIDKINGKVI